MIRRVLWLAAICVAALFTSVTTQAQDESPGAVADEAQATDEQATPPPSTSADAPEPLNTGNNAWVLTSSALVLFMTAPGLAMFYGGLVRRKNVIGVIMQCLFLMALMTVIWGLYGYSLSFGGDNPELGSKLNPYIGNTDYLFMRNVERTWNDELKAAN